MSRQGELVNILTVQMVTKINGSNCCRKKMSGAKTFV